MPFSFFSFVNPILHQDLNCMLIMPSPLHVNPPLVSLLPLYYVNSVPICLNYSCNGARYSEPP